MNYPGGWQREYSTYQGLGAFGEPPKRSRTPIVLAVVAALVLLGGGGAAAYFLTRGDSTDDPGKAQPPAPASSSAQVSSSAAPPPITQESQPTRRYAKAEPVVAGWQAVLSPREGAVYDVSDDWKVETASTLTGFEDDSGPRVTMHGSATYRDGFCEKGDSRNSYRGRAGFMTAGDADPRKAPPIAAKLWGTAAVELPEDSPKVKPSAAKPVKIAGGQKAWMSTVTVRSPVKNSCTPPSLKVTAVAFVPREGGDTAMFVMHTDAGVDDALPAAEARKIIGSLRHAEE